MRRGRCPSWIAERFAGLDDDPAGTHAVAAEVAAEQIAELAANGVEHVHLYTLNRAELALAVCERIGLVGVGAGGMSDAAPHPRGRRPTASSCSTAPAAPRSSTSASPRTTCAASASATTASRSPATTTCSCSRCPTRCASCTPTTSRPAPTSSPRTRSRRPPSPSASTASTTRRSIHELNVAGARLAREAVDAASRADGRRRWVAGAIGPTNVTLSLSPKVEDPAYRAMTFRQIAEAYRQQMAGLVEGGADVLLIETIFDTLNAKAAIWAARRLAADTGVATPLMISGTITDRSGRTLSGQTVGAFWQSVRHADPLTDRAQLRARRRRHAAVHPGAVGPRRHAGVRLPERRPAERARLLRRDARADRGDPRRLRRAPASSTSSVGAAAPRRPTSQRSPALSRASPPDARSSAGGRCSSRVSSRSSSPTTSRSSTSASAPTSPARPSSAASSRTVSSPRRSTSPAIRSRTAPR